MNPRILILHATAGAGHRRAAEALAQAATTAFPEARIECADILEQVPGWLRRAYPATYYVLVRHCATLWGLGYQLLDHPLVYALVQPLRRAWNVVMARQLIRRLRRNPPDLILTTHFFPTDVVSACKQAGWLAAPLVVVVTDLHPHRLWLSSAAEAYICGTSEGAAVAKRRGIRPERLHVLGIPIARGFHVRFDRRALQQAFQLDPARRTVLVTSGGTTVGPFEAVVNALSGLEAVWPNQLQLLVVCGDSARVAARLRLFAEQSRLPMRVHGFINNMPEAMAVSDVVVSKAGGLTVSEALGRGLPLIIYHAIPGQERLNVRYLVAHGAAMVARTPADAAQLVRRTLEDPAYAGVVQAAERAIGHPEAAVAIIELVAKPLLMKGADGR